MGGRQVEKASEMTGGSVSLKGCSKVFADGTQALERLDLDIEAGETVVMLGPSGCGKTTALRIIAGLESCDPGGRVLFDSQDVTAVPIEKRNVGMVFQSYALFPNMSVAENIGYGLRVRKVGQEERAKRVGELLEMMRMSYLADRRVDQLSGGQRQRVALARAVAVRPRVLLLDEPLTALDAKLRDALRDEINELLRSLRITAIYVTHDQTEAMALGDRIVVMSQGKVSQIGTPRDIYLRPANRFVADFIGTMNPLRGTLRAGWFECAGGRIEVPGSRDGPAEFLFRPYDATIVPAGAGGLKGKVASASFLGDRVRMTVVGLSEAPVVVESLSDAAFAPGDEIVLKLNADKLIAFEPC